MDKLSRVVRIALPSGGSQLTTVYSAKGIYEICRWSKQSKANAFYDWVYEVLETLRKDESIKQVEAIEARRLRAEAMKMNAKTRQTQMIMDLVQESQGKLSSESIQTLIEWGAELRLSLSGRTPPGDRFSKLLLRRLFLQPVQYLLRIMSWVEVKDQRV